MTTEEILDGTFDTTEVIKRKELEDLIFSISKVRDLDKVDNIIKFINYCKEYRFMDDYITRYFINLLDTNSNYDEFVRKIALANIDEFHKIRHWASTGVSDKMYPPGEWKKNN